MYNAQCTSYDLLINLKSKQLLAEKINYQIYSIWTFLDSNEKTICSDSINYPLQFKTNLIKNIILKFSFLTSSFNPVASTFIVLN